MNEEKSGYMALRHHGKSYFGEVEGLDPEGDRIVLNNVVELVTTMGMTPTGIQKRVVLVGIDYAGAPLKRMSFPYGALYELEDLPKEDADALMKDYEEFKQRNNLVKTPPKQGIVTPP